jgi:hypothetical protein
MQDESTPAQHLLGVSEGAFEVSERITLAALCLEMVSQTRRSLDIVSRHLDPSLYDNETFAAAVKQIALNHRSARIRLFVLDPRPLVNRHHRLLELAERLPGFIEIRTPSPHYKSFNEALLIADNVGYVRRQFSDRFEAEVDFSDRRQAMALSERLDEMWERGLADPNFRRLHL